VADHTLIEDYLAQLARTLPARRSTDILDELRDGLYEAFAHHPAADTDPATAAHDVLTDFGPPDLVAAAYAPGLAADQARIGGRVTLAAVPVLAGLWTTALMQGSPPDWDHKAWIPIAGRMLGTSLLLTVGCGLAAAFGTTGRRRVIHSETLAPLAAATAAVSLAVAVAVVLSLTVLRATIAPASLAYPEVLVATAITTAILRSVHRATPHPEYRQSMS
jgi:hypothetical protein